MVGKCSFCHKEVEVEEVFLENVKGFICEDCKKRYGLVQHKILEPERQY
jgi:uncharacterized protein YlaI